MKTCDGCRALNVSAKDGVASCMIGFLISPCAASKWNCAPVSDCPKPRTYYDLDVEKKNAKARDKAKTEKPTSESPTPVEDIGYVRRSPIDEDKGKSPDPLASAWDALTKEEREGTTRQAALNAKCCLLCRWYVTETNLAAFPVEARKVHLMLCAYKDYMKSREGKR